MNVRSAPESLKYSTAHIAPVRRFEYWNDVILRHCIPSDGKPPEEEIFAGELAVRQVGLIDVCTLNSTLHSWERKSQHLRTGPEDDLWLGYIQGGYGRLEQGGRKACLTAGNLVMYDAAKTFRFSIGGNCNHLIRIPRYLISGKISVRSIETATILDACRPGLIPLREMILQASLNPLLTQHPDLAGRFSQTLLDLLILSLESQDGDNVHSEYDLYAKIRNYILQHLSSPELSIDNIAQAHHVSVRTVNRAFARHQKSPAAVIWQERLLASRISLQQGRARSVSDVALDHGFTDLTHFSHAFRKAFGITPNSVLKQAKSQIQNN